MTEEMTEGGCVLKTNISAKAALRRVLAAAGAGVMLLSGCIHSVFTNPQPYPFDPPQPPPTQAMNYVDPREEGKYDSDLPDAFALDPNCVNQVSFSCLDFDETSGNFVYFYQYTYADDAYQRRKRDYDQLSDAAKVETRAPESTVMITVLASHNYVSGQTAEFFRAVTSYEGGATGMACKPPDMDGYALYFDKKVYYYTMDRVLALEADCTQAFDQLIRANSGYPQHDLVGFEVLNEGRRFVVSLMMSQAVDPESDSFPEPRTGQFACEIIRLSERPEGYGSVLSYDLAGNVTSFTAKPRYRADDVVFAVTETEFAGRPLTGYDPATGRGARLAELEAKYAVNQPLPDFRMEAASGFSVVKGTVVNLTKRYKYVRVSRREYMGSYYYSPSVPLVVFEDYFPEPPPEPTEAPTEASGEASAEVSVEAPAEAPATGRTLDGERTFFSGLMDTFEQVSLGPVTKSVIYGRSFCYLLDSASESQLDYRFVPMRRNYSFSEYWDRDARMADVLIPNGNRAPSEGVADPDYTGWLRTVWQPDPFYSFRWSALNQLYAYEDVRILEGYDIEISEDSYVCDFQVTPVTGVSEKPLYGGGTLLQSGDVFTVKDLASGADVPGTARTVASAKDFGRLVFGGGSPMVGYVVLTEPGSGANSLRIHILGAGGQISQVNVLYSDIHFISSEERALAGQDDPGYMTRYVPLPTVAPEAGGSGLEDEYDMGSRTGEDSYNADRYEQTSVLALSDSDFVITSMQNGVVRYSISGGAFTARQILEAPLFRSWRLADGSFVAVGFEMKNPSKRYNMTDFARGKVLTYTLDE
jgi:hypothetical protein